MHSLTSVTLRSVYHATHYIHMSYMHMHIDIDIYIHLPTNNPRSKLDTDSAFIFYAEDIPCKLTQQITLTYTTVTY
jgi:hypothetical protein